MRTPTSNLHPCKPMSARDFTEHLLSACMRPVFAPAFDQGHRNTIDIVSRPGIFELHGLTIDAPAGVYSPHETSSTRFFMDHFGAAGLAQPAGRLLEVGCGAGAISLLAARLGWQVFASDIDPVAVQATKANAARNGLTLEVRLSDLFAAFAGEKFDVILFNQPFLHCEREVCVEERPLSSQGGELHARFMTEARDHLATGGYVVTSYSNCSNMARFNQPGWNMELRAFDFDASADFIRALFKATDLLDAGDTTRAPANIAETLPA